MSEGRVNNEKVIDELTAGLADCVQPRPASSANAGVSNNVGPAGAAGIDPTDMSQFEKQDRESSRPAAEREFDEEHAEKSEDDDDYVDEEALKDVEYSLTTDQREERRIIAEELKKSGNDAFKRGDYDRSIEKYTDGLKYCPLLYPRDRAILYCNRSAAKMKLDKFSKAIVDCTKSIELDDQYVKAYIRRAQSYESTEKLDEALADYKRILELDPLHQEARRAAVRLPPLIEEKNEKLKAEMLGKLKDLGNMILKPFGLSTDSFQVNQDPESKGYSVNFKK